MTSQNTYDNSLSFSRIRGFYAVVGKHRHSISPEVSALGNQHLLYPTTSQG